MNKIITRVLALVMGIGVISCSSSDNDPYEPKPEKGDYTKVSSMSVITDPKNEHLVDMKYEITYNNFLKLRNVSYYDRLTAGEIVGNPDLKYEFEYLKNNSLNAITYLNSDNEEEEKLIATYSGGNLTTLKGEYLAFDYEYSNGNVVKAKSGDHEFTYGYDANGHLVSVSDASGLLTTYTYKSEGYNPFIHSEYNLMYAVLGYGGEFIRFMQNAKLPIATVTDEKTGEVLELDYTEFTEFNYPTRVVVSSNKRSILLKFSYIMVRANDN